MALVVLRLLAKLVCKAERLRDDGTWYLCVDDLDRFLKAAADDLDAGAEVAE